MKYFGAKLIGHSEYIYIRDVQQQGPQCRLYVNTFYYSKYIDSYIKFNENLAQYFSPN
jgi:hypothetical protein